MPQSPKESEPTKPEESSTSGTELSDTEVLQTLPGVTELPGAKQALKTLKKYEGKRRGRRPGQKIAPITEEEKEQFVIEYAEGKTLKEIAKLHGRTRDAVSRTIKESRQGEDKVIRTKELVLTAHSIHDKIRFLIASINSQSLEKSSAKDRAIALGILVDKMQALREDIEERTGADNMPSKSDFESLVKRVSNDLQKFTKMASRYSLAKEPEVKA